MVGMLYALPVTEREGSFAVYRPQHCDSSNHESPLYIFYPTPKQRDLVLMISFILPIISVIATGIASAVVEVQGNISSMQVLISVQYTVSGAIDLVWSCIVLYYGVNFSFILRSHILNTETRDNMPLAIFVLKNLKSGSPARYLLVMVRIMMISSSIVLILAGSLANLRAWSGENFLRPENETFFHIVAVIWSCTITIAHFVQLVLIVLHSLRNKDIIAQDLGTDGLPKHDAMNGQNSLGKLTLHLQTQTAWSQTSNTLNQMLSEFATVPMSGVDPHESSMRQGDDLREHSIPLGDEQSEMGGEEDEDLKNRVARSAIVPFSEIANETQNAAQANVTSDSSRTETEPEPQLQEFRMLQLQHQSSLRRIQTLKSNQQRRRKPWRQNNSARYKIICRMYSRV
ncbi:hypothetical protein EC968_000085 [Mortierella alpina]|nr:hypothetical protein EC968_000085 [Mortierella alpina]